MGFTLDAPAMLVWLALIFFLLPICAVVVKAARR